jgi:SAM-dependent methyltransferase
VETQCLANATEIIQGFHTSRLEEFGADDARVVWNSRHSQESRFKVLAEVGDFGGASVLDVGCGLGDFASYLTDQGIAYQSYRGIDINPDMLAAARGKYPDLEFELRDLRDAPFEREQFDYVVESGIFNIKVPDFAAIAFETMRNMFAACRTAVAMNFLSAVGGSKNPDAHYWMPSDVLAYVERELSSKFVLRHDYRTNDFTIHVYK